MTNDTRITSVYAHLMAATAHLRPLVRAGERGPVLAEEHIDAALAELRAEMTDGERESSEQKQEVRK